MDCFAEPVIGRAFARPVGCNDVENCRCIELLTSVKWRFILIVRKRNSSTRNKTDKTSRERFQMEDGIFDGLKVLDCASFIAAPAAATVLSDFGAEVIKIEPPGSGDPSRNLPNFPRYPP